MEGTVKGWSQVRRVQENVVGPCSALECLIDRDRVTTDKAREIVNDPNDWGSEICDARYIIDLIKPITTLSLETVAIIGRLPSLEEGV